jgi:hypothetical protein
MPQPDPQGLLQRALANQWVKDPTATTFQTTLPPQLEQIFMKAAQSRFGNKIEFQPDLSPTSDYDYRGWWQAAQAGDPRAVTKENLNDKQLHFSDVWKTPYHHSFSKDSQYASPTAPGWTKTQPFRLLAQQDSPVGTYKKGDIAFDEGPYSHNDFPSEVQAAMKLGWPEDATAGLMPAPVGSSPLSPPPGSPFPPGLLTPGNIDVLHRPFVKHPDGSISTVHSMSFGTPEGEALVPTVSEDARMLYEPSEIEKWQPSSSDVPGVSQALIEPNYTALGEARRNYRQTGKHLGIFQTPDQATAASLALHDDQAKMFSDLYQRFAREGNQAGMWRGNTLVNPQTGKVLYEDKTGNTSTVPQASQVPAFFPVPHGVNIAALLHALSQIR